MSDPKLSRRYAEALYAAARDQGVVDKVVEACKDVLLPMTEDTTFLTFWESRRIPLPRKLELVDEVLGGVPVPLRRFLQLLLEKNREDVLFDALPTLLEIHDRERGIVRATLATAIELNEKELEPFQALLKEKFAGDVILSHEVDPSLIAGFRLRYKDKIIDGSVARSISEIRRRMSA